MTRSGLRVLDANTVNALPESATKSHSANKPSLNSSSNLKRQRPAISKAFLEAHGKMTTAKELESPPDKRRRSTESEMSDVDPAAATRPVAGDPAVVLDETLQARPNHMPSSQPAALGEAPVIRQLMVPKVSALSVRTRIHSSHIYTKDFDRSTFVRPQEALSQTRTALRLSSAERNSLQGSNVELQAERDFYFAKLELLEEEARRVAAVPAERLLEILAQTQEEMRAEELSEPAKPADTESSNGTSAC